MEYTKKYFGTTIAFLLAIAITISMSVLKGNYLYIPALGKMSFYLWLIFTHVFYFFAFFAKKLSAKTLNRIYIGIALLSYTYLHSYFQWSIECCPEKYDSMSEWSAASSLAWMLILLFSTFIVIAQGLLYDIIMILKAKKSAE